MNKQNILTFWFGDIQQSSSYLQSRAKLWFEGSAEIDSQIKELFQTEVEKAGRGELEEWESSPIPCLELLLLLDQFSLNIYRNQAEGYLLSEKAIPIALRALGANFDHGLHPIQKIFFYLPLEHAEDLSLQEQSVAAFRRLWESNRGSFWEGYLKGTYDFAVRHQVVVDKFGRFPHRNAALGRTSTPEEIEFLKKGKPF